jgi:hypothetical protein
MLETRDYEAFAFSKTYSQRPSTTATTSNTQAPQHTTTTFSYHFAYHLHHLHHLKPSTPTPSSTDGVGVGGCHLLSAQHLRLITMIHHHIISTHTTDTSRLALRRQPPELRLLRSRELPTPKPPPDPNKATRRTIKGVPVWYWRVLRVALGLDPQADTYGLRLETLRMTGRVINRQSTALLYPNTIRRVSLI